LGRAEFARNIEANTVHGADSLENAAIEVALLFPEKEIVG
jgi:nucleoside-diphosphate kinase